ncbi:MAG TPA: NrsF family protein [Methylovirgula sp.]|jgi:hypothetical protein|nr:NrsF family protein [Methylovirgula sp.]
MKTEDLIRTLAADQSGPTSPLARALVLGLLPGIALAVLFYSIVLGPRPHLMNLLSHQPRVDFKVLLPWLLLVTAWPVTLRLVQPGANWRRAAWLLLLPVVALVVAVGVELVLLPEETWRGFWMGHNALICSTLVPLMAFGPLIAVLLVLKRSGAPTNPTLAGAGAGLIAAAFGLALYSTHCPDDSPLFVACWYGLATVITVVIGSVLGSRWLRW